MPCPMGLPGTRSKARPAPRGSQALVTWHALPGGLLCGRTVPYGWAFVYACSLPRVHPHIASDPRALQVQTCINQC